MERDRINYLTEKFFRGEGSDAEMQELATWIKNNPEDQEIGEALEFAWERYESKTRMPEDVSERLLGNILPQHRNELEAEESPANRNIRQLWPQIAAACAVLLVIGFYWLSNVNRKALIAADKKKSAEVSDVLPGGEKAILILGDGSDILLDSAGSGALAQQGNTSITKSANGELIYKANGKAEDAVVFNTVKTPKGGQYHIVLPDGSKAWLNAASSLRFPTAFKGSERRVEITGEVYFEVKHDAKMPFRVSSNGTEIEVLGTHFDVMAYDDEHAMKTTLLEGAVKVSKGGSSAKLSPGQQANISNRGFAGIKVLNDVDVEKEMAWKNGFFQFDDENLEGVMRQVSRWYDVDVTYEGNLGKEHYTGRLPRNANVSKVFKILSLSGVRFRIEGRTIIVTP